MRYSITEKQAFVFRAIETYMLARNQAPSIDELINLTGIGRSRVHALLCSLERRGWIKKMPYRSRSIVILPDTLSTADIQMIVDNTPDNRVHISILKMSMKPQYCITVLKDYRTGEVQDFTGDTLEEAVIHWEIWARENGLLKEKVSE